MVYWNLKFLRTILWIMIGKVQKRHITEREWRAVREELSTCFAQLRKAHIGVFLLDLLTESEQIMLARRLRIARMLLQGHSDIEIRSSLGVGFDTIRQVHSWLDRKFRDYRKTLAPALQHAEKEGLRHKRIGKIPLDPMGLRAFRKRYPSQLALLDLIFGDPDIYEIEP